MYVCFCRCIVCVSLSKLHISVAVRRFCEHRVIHMHAEYCKIPMTMLDSNGAKTSIRCPNMAAGLVIYSVLPSAVFTSYSSTPYVTHKHLLRLALTW